MYIVSCSDECSVFSYCSSMFLYSRQLIFPYTGDLSSQLLVNVSFDNEHVLR